MQFLISFFFILFFCLLVVNVYFKNILYVYILINQENLIIVFTTFCTGGKNLLVHHSKIIIDTNCNQATHPKSHDSYEVSNQKKPSKASVKGANNFNNVIYSIIIL
jgi:hypothetical protein